MFLLYLSFIVKIDLKNGIINWYFYKVCMYNIVKLGSIRVEDIKRIGLWCICRCVFLFVYII